MVVTVFVVSYMEKLYVVRIGIVQSDLWDTIAMNTSHRGQIRYIYIWNLDGASTQSGNISNAGTIHDVGPEDVDYDNTMWL
jgi:hypothetical protein